MSCSFCWLPSWRPVSCPVPYPSSPAWWTAWWTSCPASSCGGPPGLSRDGTPMIIHRVRHVATCYPHTKSKSTRRKGRCFVLGYSSKQEPLITYPNRNTKKTGLSREGTPMIIHRVRRVVSCKSSKQEETC